MKKYIVELDNVNKSLFSSTEENVTELGMVLQIWQDLYRLEKTWPEDVPAPEEDKLIKKILGQILNEELGENIAVPEYYQRDAEEHKE